MSAIFISHSTKDKEAAEQIHKRLKNQGHEVFLDSDRDDGIPIGTDWERVLYANLRRCQAVVYLCSQKSIDSKWCFAELTHARRQGKTVFPLKIEDCSIEAILSDTQGSMVTNKIFDPDNDDDYEILWRGFKEANLDDVFQWDGKHPPYPGLMAFKEEDAALFFGRREEAKDGIEQLQSLWRGGVGGERLVLYQGASGSGKSSLVRAGIVPRLKRPDQAGWIQVVDPFRPRGERLGNPFDNLASVLNKANREAPPITAESLITSESPHR